MKNFYKKLRISNRIALIVSYMISWCNILMLANWNHFSHKLVFFPNFIKIFHFISIQKCSIQRLIPNKKDCNLYFLSPLHCEHNNLFTSDNLPNPEYNRTLIYLHLYKKLNLLLISIFSTRYEQKYIDRNFHLDRLIVSITCVYKYPYRDTVSRDRDFGTLLFMLYMKVLLQRKQLQLLYIYH